MEVRYTDVDYLVFSDAAMLMSSGKSPYQRTTYRYSPMLARLHHSWGKFLFSASGNYSAILWFFCLLVARHTALPWSDMKLKWEFGVSCILCWMVAQTHWLMWGYLLEFRPGIPRVLAALAGKLAIPGS
ncbi:hypothetical protein Dimus_027514 [Dionaea muscipula]